MTKLNERTSRSAADTAALLEEISYLLGWAIADGLTPDTINEIIRIQGEIMRIVKEDEGNREAS